MSMAVRTRALPRIAPVAVLSSVSVPRPLATVLMAPVAAMMMAAALFARPGRLRAGRARNEALEGAHGQYLPEQPLDELEQRPFVVRHERHGETFVAGTSRAADTMDIMFGHFG